VERDAEHGRPQAGNIHRPDSVPKASRKTAEHYSERNSHSFGYLILSGSGARKKTRNTRLPKSSGPQGQKKTALERAVVIHNQLL
jgi:hypothetical protein